MGRGDPGRLFVSIVMLGFFALFQACNSANAAEDLAQRWAAAISDAQNVTSSKISKNLTAITADEPGLVWEGTAGDSRLLVITTMSQGAYEGFGYKDAYESGDPYTLSDSVLAWVTVVPEAILYFKALGYAVADATNLRFAEALGLPEPAEERMVVGLYVNTSDLFRPCPDPEINDHECETDFPTNHSGGFLAFDQDVLLMESDPCATDGCTYDEWFEARRGIVYTGSSAFPWTQLGYTYDWGTDAPEGNIGISEFAVKGGSTFSVVSAETASWYFANNWDTY